MMLPRFFLVASDNAAAAQEQSDNKDGAGRNAIKAASR
jgi:hypothetical protein